MELVILAAGGHRRLPDLQVPKALIEFDGMTITEEVVRCFAPWIDGVMLCVGYKAEMIEKRIGSSLYGIPVCYCHNEDFATTGAAWSLYLAREFYKGRECIITEGDQMLHPEIVRRLMESPYPNCVPIDNASKPEYGEETVITGKDGVVSGMYWPARDYTYTEPVVGEVLVTARMCSGASLILPDLLDTREIINPFDKLYKGFPCEWHYVCTDGLPWIEIDTPEDLARAQQVFQQIKEDL